MPTAVVPVTPKVRFMIGHDDEMKCPNRDRQITTRAKVLLASCIWLDRANGHPENIAHTTRAIAAPMASTTMIRSTAVLSCSRNGLKPIVER